MSDLIRLPLSSWRRGVVAQDVAETLRHVELRASRMKFPGVLRVEVPSSASSTWSGVESDPGPTGYGPELSMRPAGRELRLWVEAPGLSRQKAVELIWAAAVPCGVTPWLRYPVCGAGDDVFHVLGPWQALYDSMLGEGLGELAWPSLCAAAQADVGRWEGPMGDVVFLQAQLHRLGAPCGPVDGEVTERVLSCARALGIPPHLLPREAGLQLSRRETPKPKRGSRGVGFISLGSGATATASGSAYLTRTAHGYAVTYDGYGRIVVDLPDPSA